MIEILCMQCAFALWTVSFYVYNNGLMEKMKS